MRKSQRQSDGKRCNERTVVAKGGGRLHHDWSLFSGVMYRYGKFRQCVRPRHCGCDEWWLFRGQTQIDFANRRLPKEWNGRDLYQANGRLNGSVSTAQGALGGCSNGGRHTMVTTARYADQYDGFLAGAPGYNLPKAAVTSIWSS